MAADKTDNRVGSIDRRVGSIDRVAKSISTDVNSLADASISINKHGLKQIGGSVALTRAAISASLDKHLMDANESAKKLRDQLLFQQASGMADIKSRIYLNNKQQLQAINNANKRSSNRDLRRALFISGGAGVGAIADRRNRLRGMLVGGLLGYLADAVASTYIA